MITRMVMPQVNITAAEVKLIAWLKKIGDPVKRGDPVLEVETEKATVEVESYVDGYLRAQFFPSGAIVPVEAVIAVITTTPEEKFSQQAQAESKANTSTDSKASIEKEQARTPSVKNDRIDISPLARKIAESNQIDIQLVKGSGPHGRVIKEDIETAIQLKNQNTFQVESKPFAQPTSDSSMRSAIAQRTALSKATIPHYYVSIEIDMKSSLKLIEDLKKVASSRAIDPPTITDLILWACGKTLPQYPNLHGSWKEHGAVINPEINLGIVVGLDEGLIVPVLHHAEKFNLFDLTAATRKLKQKARQGGLTSRDLTGGTFTVSNLGMHGINSFIAVINPPESAILALGTIIKRPVVNEKDQVIVRPILTASLSVDHRMIDGIMAAKFLKALKEVLENPSLLMFES